VGHNSSHQSNFRSSVNREAKGGGGLSRAAGPQGLLALLPIPVPVPVPVLVPRAVNTGP